MVSPLYLYTEDGERQPNFDEVIISEFQNRLGMTLGDDLTPEDVLDYIYAVLHSPSYRETYQEFLKVDFPRVPFPSDQQLFAQLVALGKELRQYHLMEHARNEDFITTYPEAGSDTVEKKYPKYTDGKVYINDTQYIGNVPETAWSFYIGGYQPAQKWLKDRRERKLSMDEIIHYQKIIIALTHTDRLMQAIDAVIPDEMF